MNYEEGSSNITIFIMILLDMTHLSINKVIVETLSFKVLIV